MELLFYVWRFHGIPWNLVLASSTMELSKFHGIPWNFPFDHGIPWNSMELWNIDINEFHNWESVFHCLLHDFMLLYIRQSISSWNIEIFQFQSNFLMPLILLKRRYSILNGGLLYMYMYIYIYISVYVYIYICIIWQRNTLISIKAHKLSVISFI